MRYIQTIVRAAPELLAAYEQERDAETKRSRARGTGTA
jgi:hypothetical protein